MFLKNYFLNLFNYVESNRPIKLKILPQVEDLESEFLSKFQPDWTFRTGVVNF
jgi:hypothetical protein